MRKKLIKIGKHSILLEYLPFCEGYLLGRFSDFLFLETSFVSDAVMALQLLKHRMVQKLNIFLCIFGIVEAS